MALKDIFKKKSYEEKLSDLQSKRKLEETKTSQYMTLKQEKAKIKKARDKRTPANNFKASPKNKKTLDMLGGFFENAGKQSITGTAQKNPSTTTFGFGSQYDKP